MKRKIVGYMVFERSECGDIEQALALDQSDGLPDRGILNWCYDGRRACLFPNRVQCQTAILRTEHYRLAYEQFQLWPNKRDCVIVQVEAPNA
jgi:hypothetical protein